MSSNVTKSVSYGLELANQVLDKEIEIEIDVDKVANQVSTLANKTVEESKVLPQKQGLFKFSLENNRKVFKCR